MEESNGTTEQQKATKPRSGDKTKSKTSSSKPRKSAAPATPSAAPQSVTEPVQISLPPEILAELATPVTVEDVSDPLAKKREHQQHSARTDTPKTIKRNVPDWSHCRLDEERSKDCPVGWKPKIAQGQAWMVVDATHAYTPAGRVALLQADSFPSACTLLRTELGGNLAISDEIKPIFIEIPRDQCDTTVACEIVLETVPDAREIAEKLAERSKPMFEQNEPNGSIWIATDYPTDYFPGGRVAYCSADDEQSATLLLAIKIANNAPSQLIESDHHSLHLDFNMFVATGEPSLNLFLDAKKTELPGLQFVKRVTAVLNQKTNGKRKTYHDDKSLRIEAEAKTPKHDDAMEL